MRLQPTHRWSSLRVRLFILEPEKITPEYVAWMNDPVVCRYLESRFSENTEESIRHFVEQQIAAPNSVFFGIWSMQFERHVGNIKLGPIDFNHGRGEVGIMIGDKGAWGFGIAAEALRVLCDVARSQLGLRKITAGCYASNGQSMKAFTKAGFEIEGRRPAHFILDGKAEDLIMMARYLESAE